MASESSREASGEQRLGEGAETRGERLLGQERPGNGDSLRFYCTGLYEPGEPAGGRSGLAAQEEQPVPASSWGLPREAGSADSPVESPSFRPAAVFDPFLQVVDSESACSPCSDPPLSPSSDLPSRIPLDRSHPGPLTRDLSRESEGDPQNRELPEGTVPDVFCQSCGIPIPAFEKLFGSHRHHRVAPLSLAVEAAKMDCQDNIRKLGQQLVQVETFVSHMEEIFVTVEENIGKQQHYLELQYDDLMQFLVQRYEDRCQELEEEKKLKLQKLYGELVSCGQNIDLYKELIESTEELFKTEDKQTFLKDGQTALARLEEFLQVDFNPELPTTTEFEKFPTDMPEVQRLIDTISSLPVPSAPSMCPQAPGTGSSDSVRVSWSLSADDTVEFYQLHYREVTRDTSPSQQGAADMSLRVKEMYHTVRDLKPNTVYEFWVTASNSAGTSPGSDRAKHTTVPLAPTIKRKAVASCPNAALIEWESEGRNSADSYTVEFCKVCSSCDWTESLTESLTGITSCKTIVDLEPNENYLFYVRALNEGGCSDRSSPVSIRTTGNRFYLMEQTAHLALSLLEDGVTIVYNEDNVCVDSPNYDERFTSCAAVMGQLVPVRGKHYWEVEVTEQTEYRIGVASHNISRDSYIGSNITSWCMRHTLSPTRNKFEFLHNGITPDVRITVIPKQIGILLNYDTGKLSFFNVTIRQHLFTFSHPFQQLVNPCFALEGPGSLKICHGIPTPEFIRLP
ncbi:fibronectin type III and SPRY domain-containing protein 2 isoform X1 [Chiloscyllium punctatum]